MSLKPSAEAKSALEWTKSSYSSNEGPDCVEVATASDAVLVRDSKDPDGPHLAVSPEAWTSFVGFAAQSEI